MHLQHLRNIWISSLLFIKDILIYSKMKEEHVEHLRITWIFRGKKSYMQNFRNVNFDRASTVLGHIVSKKEMSVDP